MSLTILVGMPGCGKSTYAAEKATKLDDKIVSSDLIRLQLTGDIQDQSQNKEVFAQFYRLIKSELAKNACVIADATNLDYRSRRELRAIAEKANVECHAVVWANPGEAIRRNLARDRVVPMDVMGRFGTKLHEALMAIEDENYASITYIREEYANA